MNRKRGEKLYAQVFRQVRAYIIQHNLQPGDLLPTEQALVEMLGVSRNVLREAIKSMELMGLVSARRGAARCSRRSTWTSSSRTSSSPARAMGGPLYPTCWRSASAWSWAL